MRRALFKNGKFTAHSGDILSFKIECDALTDESIECIAEFIASKTSFGTVEGIPTGGTRLAKALEKYAVYIATSTVLIVDDVLTTGASMEQCKADQPPQVNRGDVVGWVIFARTQPPDWINAVFCLYEEGDE